MSALPKSIQQQIEEAQRHFEIVKNPEEITPTPDEPVAPDTATQSADPEPNADDEKHSQDEPKRSEGYWEHRFNVINGKFVAEVSALRDEVKGLKSTLEQKDRQLTESQHTPAPSGNPGGLTNEQIQAGKDEFGDDFVSFVQKMIDSKAPPDNSKVQELEGKVRQFEEREQQKSQASFWTVLPELVPNWKDINADPKFHAFLAQYDPQTGTQRQNDLVAAQQALDADKVGAIFNAFKNNQPAPQRKIPDDQIDPQSSRSNGQAPQGGTIWTGAEIKRFYQEKSLGKYSADEGQRLEADIFQAQKEGRTR